MNEQEEKIEYIKRELANMQKNLNNLAELLNEIENKQNYPEANNQPIQKREITEEVIKESTQVIEQEKKPEVWDEKINNADNVQFQSKPEKKDFEKLIGKNFMGICASVLIFISFILVAQVIYPYLNDVIKVIGMYCISFAFIAIGYLNMKKNGKNTFNLSLTGCGLGAVYISLFLTNIYFKMISDVTLYILISIWAIFVICLSRVSSNVFHTIGQAGVTIAVIFGASSVAFGKDIDKMLLIIIFMIVGSLAFYFSNRARSNVKDIVNNLFNIVNIFAVIPMLSVEELNTVIFVSSIILMIAFALFNMAISYLRINPEKKEDFSYAIFNICYFVALLNIFEKFINTSSLMSIVAIVLGIVLLILNEIKFRKPNILNSMILQFFYLVIIATYCIQNETLSHIAITNIFAIALAIYGFVSKNDVFKYASLVYISIGILNFDSIKWIRCISGIIALVTLTYNILTKKEQYSVALKNITYGVFQFFILITVNIFLDEIIESHEIRNTLILMMMSILSVFAIHSIFGSNIKNRELEKGTQIYLGIVNVMLMIAGLSMISSYDAFIPKTIAILSSLLIFSVNSKNLLDNNRNAMWPGIYIGIKYTVLLNTILDSFDTPAIIVSIILLIFAIIALMIGFALKYKSVRVYGLVLTLTSIVKLVLIDINYSSTLAHAVSVFVCGILCFGVSKMYNYVDKRIGK